MFNNFMTIMYLRPRGLFTVVVTLVENILDDLRYAHQFQ